MAKPVDVYHNVQSLLSSLDRNFLLRNNGDQIHISELEGKIVCLYFYGTSYKSCSQFTPQLKEVYEKLKGYKKDFEVVLIPLDHDEESFKKEFESMPWLSLPIKDKSCEKLVVHFELSILPTLVVVGPDGKTLHPNIAEAIKGDGIDAYDLFPLEKKFEDHEISKANEEEEQTLESILVFEDQDFVIGKDGVKIPVSELSENNVLLYFTASWCPPCHAFLTEFLKTYDDMKKKYDAPKVVFISIDRDEASHDKFFDSLDLSFAKYLWPEFSFSESRYKIPFGDSRTDFLRHKFKVHSIPTIVWIGSSGQSLTTEARDLFVRYGVHAYPFITEGWPEKVTQKTHDHELVLRNDRWCYVCGDCNEHIFELSYCCKECDFDLHPRCVFDNAEKEEGWPEKVMHQTHDHELGLTRCRSFICDGCDEDIDIWAYCCNECDFGLHPKCALEDKESKVYDEKHTDVSVSLGDVCSEE